MLDWEGEVAAPSEDVRAAAAREVFLMNWRRCIVLVWEKWGRVKSPCQIHADVSGQNRLG